MHSGGSSRDFINGIFLGTVFGVALMTIIVTVLIALLGDSCGS
jgi:hypothetical protein